MKELLLLLTILIQQAYALTFDLPEGDWQIILPGVDLDRVCSAIAVAETSGCTAGVGKSKNNCQAMKAGGKFRTFASPEDSQAACRDVYARLYNRPPDIEVARRWTGGEGSRWLGIVSSRYHSQP
jgi:hypothetical protein